MSKVYKTYDYSHIPIQEIEDKDLCDFYQIANLTISDLCKKQNAMLKISVVLCTYNGEKYFKRTIRFYYKSDISYL